MAAAARAKAALPAPLRRAGVAAAAVVLTLFFVYLGFPSDRLAGFVEARLGRVTGARVAVEEIRPSLHLAGPGFTATVISQTDSSRWAMSASTSGWK